MGVILLLPKRPAPLGKLLIWGVSARGAEVANIVEVRGFEEAEFYATHFPHCLPSFGLLPNPPWTAGAEEWVHAGVRLWC